MISPPALNAPCKSRPTSSRAPKPFNQLPRPDASHRARSTNAGMRCLSPRPGPFRTTAGRGESMARARVLCWAWNSGKQLPNHLAVADNGDRSSRTRVVFLGVIDAEVVVERRRASLGENPSWRGARALSSLCPTTLPPLHSATRHEHEHAARVVIPAAFGTPRIDLGRASEFAGHEHGGRRQQAFLVQSD